VVTFSDITESVTAAEALRRSNETLERRVAERTAELTQLNAALERARAEAEAANLGKTRFLAAASHDILQPLNAARLFTSSLVERQAGGDQGRLAKNVDAALESVEDILSALLDISRMDAGALKPEMACFCIGDLLQTLAVEFQPIAQERGLQLRVLPSRLAVRSDRKMLRRVLQNLISNALKYTPKGRVLVGCRRAGAALRIEVHDTGPGIPENKRKLIFQEFQRLGQEGGPKPGLGLGLSIVERIAKTLKAPLKLSSRLGAGACFAIAVPIARDAAQPADVAAKAPALSAAAANLNILVVDNEASILEGMQTLLDGWGCRILTARTAAEAIRVWEQAGEPVDLILADYHLHRSDGLQVIESLRSRAQRPVPAILITADRSRRVQDEAAGHGVHFLKKPVKPAALRAAMSHAMAQAVAAE
jgi:signal transduction histidine kinase/ActR/RegA family two-component response regulator